MLSMHRHTSLVTLRLCMVTSQSLGAELAQAIPPDLEERSVEWPTNLDKGTLMQLSHQLEGILDMGPKPLRRHLRGCKTCLFSTQRALMAASPGTLQIDRALQVAKRETRPSDWFQNLENTDNKI